MNILFLLPRYSTEETSSTLEKELVEEFSKNVGSAIQSIVAVIWREYERELKKQKALDFDDLLIESVKILKNNTHSIRLF